MRLLNVLALGYGAVYAGRTCELDADRVPTPFCGEKGFVDPSGRTPPLNVSLNECAVLAEQYWQGDWEDDEEKRVYFSFNEEHNLCTLYRDYAWDILFRPSEEGLRFFDIECWWCHRECLDPPGKNVIFNGDLTYSNRSVFPFEYNEDWYIGPGVRTERVMSCDRRETYFCGLEASFYTCRAQLYLFSFSYYVILDEYDEFELYFGIGPSAYFFSETFDRPFRKLYFSFHPDQVEGFFLNLYVEFLFYSGAAIISIESVQAVPQMSAVPSKADAKNLIENGGFETGHLKPWEVRDRYDYKSHFRLQSPEGAMQPPTQQDNKCRSEYNITSPGFESDYAFTIRAPRSRCGWKESGIKLVSNYFRTTPGSVYLLSFDFHGNLNRISTVVNLDSIGRWSPSNNYFDDAASRTMFQNIPNSNGWHRFERVVTASTDETYLYLGFLHLQNPNPGDVYVVDNVAFTEVDPNALEAELHTTSGVSTNELDSLTDAVPAKQRLMKVHPRGGENQA